MKILFGFILFLIWNELGCAPSGSSGSQDWERKIDPRLRLEMQGVQAKRSGQKNYPVLIKFKTPLSGAQKSELEKNHVRLLSQTGDIATALLPAPAISELAKKDYVIYLEWSKERSLQPDVIETGEQP